MDRRDTATLRIYTARLEMPRKMGSSPFLFPGRIVVGEIMALEAIAKDN